MKKTLILIAILSLFSDFASASALGGYDPGAINSQSVRDLQLHEAVTRARAKNDAIIKAKNAQEPKREVVDATIQSVTFLNNHYISSAELSALVRDKINKPMSMENISAIRKTVMRYYQQKGFFSAIAMVAQQDFKTGTVVIEVREGTRNSVTVEQ